MTRRVASLDVAQPRGAHSSHPRGDHSIQARQGDATGNPNSEQPVRGAAGGHSWSAAPFGYVAGFDCQPGLRLIPKVETPEQLLAALDELGSAAKAMTVWIDDRGRAARLGGALRAAGYSQVAATTHLALVGPIAAERGAGELRVERIESDGLERWAEVKLMAFGDTETLASRERLEKEMAVRSAELPLAQLWLARLGEEPVAVLAFYEGADQLVFNLGTRLPYRHQKIAQRLLRRWADEGARQGCRSLLINADDGGRPEALYRRLGFSDEVYWCARYERQPS